MNFKTLDSVYHDSFGRKILKQLNYSYQKHKN